MSTNNKKNGFDFESFKEQAMADIYQGKKMGGPDGVFGPLLKHFLETMLEGELENHLEEEKAKGVANRRNGKATKTVRSMQSGAFELETSRDRNGTFEPQILPKRQLIITDQLEENVITLYAKGSSTRDIANYIMEMYGMDISATEISRITDKVIPAMKEWRERPLESIYPFVFLDCMFYKVKKAGSVTPTAVYNILGINQEGKKELIGVYLAETEGAKFWLSVLTNLKNRGVQDIIVACVDGLKGFPEAIQAVFPQTQVQLCIVHQIRNSLRFVPHKDKKAVAADLKPIYTAISEEQGYDRLLEFEEKWAKTYPLAAKGWLDNWEHLSTYFDFDPHIRKAIYTTNAIEAMHRQVRKVTKTKGAFTSEESLLKLIYLAIKEVSKKWTMPIHNWGLTMSQLYIKFGDRLQP
ncbi:IS256 family transposase [Myroides odoratimimus]|nr:MULTISPECIES: IS256 family transposase [Myroides]MDM1363327.1 IS256 family transposase [Myroides marinus]MDM1497186.1 IS256 family transposase [Myroides odoratimimus]MDM1513577.1 IS256 family transposase [Myroides odoratimimus]MDM1530997.1 IS256 family transposase [Myroides odoratimimus]MDM1537815.1 IS256 family transposase [Myroides odoratimimus]